MCKEDVRIGRRKVSVTRSIDPAAVATAPVLPTRAQRAGVTLVLAIQNIPDPAAQNDAAFIGVGSPPNTLPIAVVSVHQPSVHLSVEDYGLAITQELWAYAPVLTGGTLLYVTEHYWEGALEDL